MIIPFADWSPDGADLGSGATKITNVVPAQRSFQPFPSFASFTTAITAYPRGGIEAFDKDDAAHLYIGDAGNLYELDTSDFTWTEVSKAATTYSTAAGEIWNFTRWENKVIGTNFADVPQQMTMGGANFTDLTTAFKARNITVVGDFVVASNTWDSSDGNVPNRVRWSAISDETDWTVSASTLSDYRDLTTGGPIRRIIGGEVGIIVSERSIFRMSFVGAPVVFQIDEILPNIGTVTPGSVTSLGDDVYLISDQGFILVTGNGTGITPIGAGRVDQWFFGDYDSDYPHKVFSMPDPTNNRILWCFPGSGHSGMANKIIIYDRTFDKWSLIEQDVEMIMKSKGIAINLDALDSYGYTDIDAMDVSFDSGAFKALASKISAFGSDLKFGFFSGSNMTATLETGEIELNPGSKTGLKAFRPLVDGGTVTGKVGQRSIQSDSVTWSGSLTQSSSGRFTKRANDNYHRFRLTVTGDLWTDAIGVQVEKEDAGRSGRRA